MPPRYARTMQLDAQAGQMPVLSDVELLAGSYLAALEMIAALREPTTITNNDPNDDDVRYLRGLASRCRRLGDELVGELDGADKFLGGVGDDLDEVADKLAWHVYGVTDPAT